MFSFLLPPKASIALLALISFISLVPSAWAANRVVDTGLEKSSGFSNGLAPFYTCTTYSNNAGVATQLDGQPCVKFAWHQAGYNGTRVGRGTEACSDLQIQKEGWYGFYIYLPDPGYPMNKEAGVAQWFANNSACNSWAGMLIMLNNDLKISHRRACVTPTDAIIYPNFPRNRWVSIIGHFVVSHQKAGQFEIFIDGVSRYRATGIDFGFDTWTADDALQAPNHIGLKFGQYDYDDGHYDLNEVRTSYYTNVTQIAGNPPGALDYIRLPIPGSARSNASQLINISTRSFAGAGSSTQIAGFIIEGTADRKVLIRAGGPYLAQFGVGGVLADPVLTLFDGNTPLATNDDWGSDSVNITAASTKAGVVPFSSGSKDAALVATLHPGHPYTALVTGKGSATGIAIAEVYDIDDGSTSSLFNMSTRSFVGTGAGIQIAGVILHGPAPRTVLIRAGGPYLTQYGVDQVLADPVLTVFKGQTQIAQNDDWTSASAEIDAAQKSASVVPFAPASKDAALVLTLDPDQPYTMQVTGKNGTEGNALVEVYTLP